MKTLLVRKMTNHIFQLEQEQRNDLGLLSRQIEILVSRLKQWNLEESDFKVTCARDRNLASFEKIFKDDDTDKKFVYCVDVN